MASTRDGFKRLFEAVRDGELELVKSLVENENIPVILDDESYRDRYYRPMNVAAITGNLDCLRYLLGRDGVYADVRDGTGATPLMRACERGKTDIVKYLLEEGADPFLLQDTGSTRPLSNPDSFGLAAMNGRRACLSVIADHAKSNGIDIASRVTASSIIHAMLSGSLRTLRHVLGLGGYPVLDYDVYRPNEPVSMTVNQKRGLEDALGSSYTAFIPPPVVPFVLSYLDSQDPDDPTPEPNFGPTLPISAQDIGKLILSCSIESWRHRVASWLPRRGCPNHFRITAVRAATEFATRNQQRLPSRLPRLGQETHEFTRGGRPAGLTIHDYLAESLFEAATHGNLELLKVIHSSAIDIAEGDRESVADRATKLCHLSRSTVLFAACGTKPDNEALQVLEWLDDEFGAERFDAHVGNGFYANAPTAVMQAVQRDNGTVARWLIKKGLAVFDEVDHQILTNERNSKLIITLRDRDGPLSIWSEAGWESTCTQLGDEKRRLKIVELSSPDDEAWTGRLQLRKSHQDLVASDPLGRSLRPTPS